MAGIGDLDADGARVHVVLAAPERSPGVPGPTLLGHERNDASVGVDEVVRRHAAFRVAKPGERLIGIRHAGIVEEQDVDRPALALAVVRRGAALDGKRHARARMASMRSHAALIAASRSLAMRTNSSGRPRAISRSG